MKTLLKLTIFICLCGRTTTAAAAPLSESEILKKYSYSDLVQVVNGMESALGGDGWCSLTMDEAAQLILPLRPIYEQKLAQEQKAIQKVPVVKLEARVKECRKSCLCGNDEDLIKARKDFPKSTLSWLKKSDKFTPEEIKACGLLAQRFCKDPLLTALKVLWEKDYKAE